MFSDELILLIIIGLVILYWYDAMHAREIARTTSIRACKSSEVSCLDDTVSLSKLRLKKNTYGQFGLYREYQFDFTSDGYSRHHGLICMQGKRVINVDLGVYRV